MTFPLDLPADLENAEVLRAHDWQAFSQVDFMQNHWDRPGWVEGRRSYHWMLSFHEDLVVQDLASRCQAELVRPDFDPVPLDALHLTIGRVAFADETAQDTVDRLVEIAKVKCKKLAPFGLEVGPLAGSRGAIRFTVAPWLPLLELHRTLAEATADVFDDMDRMQTPNFRPHVSIAYCNQTVPVSSLLPLVGRLRALSPVSTSVVAASLVELRREERAYRYEEMARLDLAGY
ncbi:2'-5' RNA ligase superfamily protein [Lentzea aerocolonigenes]|nr:2'-5' RNA ligase superfamily protein [Lentzea aerocolonigenes]